MGDEVEFTADGRDVDPDFVDRSLNEWDACAVEEALRVRERLGGEVVVVTVGDAEAEGALRRCLAMGADRAIRVDAGPVDPVSTARGLAAAVAGESPELVLTGVQSADSVQGSTGVALAELLGLPRVAVVTKLEWSGSGPATVDRELEGGLVDVVEVDTPALLTIQTGINEPRYANLRAIKQAEQQEIAVVAADTGEPAYRVRRMFTPPRGAGAELLEGSPAEVAGRIVELVRERLA
ncbi:MAG TPA: electron transfer flavoprotein subunit beta/FixA family protein [Gaiellaceae bacterium]|nr:electron transfer flavoprotein subunit beta/FixA family protein [Gaiellaceae bacterium]